MVPVGATLLGSSGTYSCASSDWHRSLLDSLYTQRRATLMDLLDRRGGLFWIGLPWRSGMVNDVGVESCRKITCLPPVGQCRQVQWPLCLCLDEMEEVGEEVPMISRPGWPPTGFAGAHYPPTIGSRVHATWPSSWLAPLVLPPSLGARGGTSLLGDGLLDCWT